MDRLDFIFGQLLLASLMLACVMLGFVRAGQRRDAELALIKRHMADLDAQHAKGLISDDDHAAARRQAARRLLASAQAAEDRHDPRRPPFWLWGLGLVTPVFAVAPYLLVGAPDYADQPYAARVAQWRDTDPSRLAPEEVIAVLEDIARQQPRDPEPLKHLAMVRRANADLDGAVETLRKAVALAPERADLWADLGEALVGQAKGEVDAQARAAFAEALARDPRQASARYHLAKARIAGGDLKGGLEDWRALLADMAPQDPRRRPLGAEIQAVAAHRGLPAPPAPRGEALPTSAIEAMVNGLADRLKKNPDDPDGWIRLVRAYAVLGDPARRDRALAQASVRFGDQPKVLSALRQAADAAPGAPSPAAAR